ncbi:MAG TPA: hypothetical protein VI076_00920 [Actinopolymorphaceae bacterium]
MTELHRLVRIRELLDNRSDVDVTHTRLLCFSGAGFTEEIRAYERRGEVVLVDLERLYTGE